jgi:putative FmdB family regulatory protein
MPLYEYKCKECGLRFERRQSFSEEPVTICPDCEGAVIRLIQPAGIIFKGSGFYVTDNRGKSSTAVAGKSKDEKDTDTSSSTTEKKETAKTTSTAETGKSEATASNKTNK